MHDSFASMGERLVGPFDLVELERVRNPWPEIGPI